MHTSFSDGREGDIKALSIRIYNIIFLLEVGYTQKGGPLGIQNGGGSELFYDGDFL
jgi:hypothetical protein